MKNDGQRHSSKTDSPKAIFNPRPKGKCFSKVNCGQRLKQDDYQTPISMINQFLEMKILGYPDKTSILEPAMGKGSIVRSLKEHGYKKVVAYDIQQGIDFLNETQKFDMIITNPPFRKANDFIRKASEVCKREFIFLMPINYLHGKNRYLKFYGNPDFRFKLSELYIYTRMPMLTNEITEFYATGMQVYAWFVFTLNHHGDVSLNWIDNNRFVRHR